VDPPEGFPPFGQFRTTRIERIDAGETIEDAEFTGMFRWAEEDPRCKAVQVDVSIEAADLHGQRWGTTYALLA
jgi:hypothetical protein